MIPYIVELLTTGPASHMVAGVLLLFGGAAFAVCGVALSLIDLREHRLPNRIVYPWSALTAVLLVIVSFLLTDPGSLGRATASGLLWSAVFLLIRLAVPAWLGMGDVKLALVLGLYAGFLGWSALLSAVVLSFLLGGLLSIALLLSRRASTQTRIPFGPFMIVGTALALIFS